MRLWLTAAKIAWREARAARLKFVFVLFGVAAGVGALTGVRGFSAAFYEALDREARTLMAADLSIRQFQTPDEKQQAVLDRYAAEGSVVTLVTETVSMMSGGGSAPPVLVSVKAIDPALYPFYGTVRLDPPGTLAAVLTDSTIAVSEDLLIRLELQPGAEVKLGNEEFTVGAVVKTEPDRMTGSLNVGPRVMITREGLERAGLMTFGSRAAQRYLLKTPPGLDLTKAKAELRKDFPEARVATANETHPAITRALERSTTFLSLVSLIALIVGALGVATAIHAHLQQRLDTIAIMKCIGARSSQIIRIYTLETAMLGLAGGLAGIVVGAGVQWVFPMLLSRYFEFEHGMGWSSAFALEGLGVGLLVTLLFTLPPLLSIRQVRPALIFRREMAEAKPEWRERLRRQLPAVLCGLLILAGLGGVAAWLAESLRMGVTFIGGLAASLLILGLVAWILLRFLRIFVTNRSFSLPITWRQGLANLYRPGNHAGAVLVSLGIGVMFTLTIYLIQKSLLSEVAGAAPPNAPNVFIINVTERERAGLQAILDGQPGLPVDPKARPKLSPLVAARLTAIDGTLPDRESLKGFDRRLLSTRQVTWVEEKPEDVQVRQGEWWAAGAAESLLAVDENTAQTLGVSVGDQVRWEVTGRQFDTRVGALYRVQSVSPGGVPDFYFNRKALEGAPVQYLGTARIAPAQVPKLQREVFAKYPTITVVNVADVLVIVQEVVDQVSLVVRFISAFAILAGAIILASTVAGTRFRRMREAAVLKTIGARRRRLVGIFSVEFLVLGLVAGIMGSVLATGFTRLLLVRLLDAEFKFDVLPNVLTIVLTAVLAVATGWLASLRVLEQKPLEVLREE
ncbi:MAG TPA: ABC transporter permease [Solibacterales bacterium]|nr:ABC transporter permease [Bryobacterales bacterium]